MNTRFADKIFRMIFIFVFVMGTVWIPNTLAGASPPLAQGDGLHAEYRQLGGSEVVLTVHGEGPINHGWTGACPDTTIYQNQCGSWAGIWNSWSLLEESLSGYVEAPETGTYIFQSWIDDYLEITINGITDLADDPGGAVYSIELDLTEGQFYPISMHFKNRWGSNDLSLWWIRPGGTNEIVPKQYLYTEIPSQGPELTLEKSASPLTYLQAGDVINYSYQLTNTGDEILTGPFTVTDDKTTVACPSGNLDGTVLFDHFENASLAQYVSGAPSYVSGQAGYGQAIDLSSGAWMRYNVPGWYQWSGNYDPGGKAGSVDLWVYPKQYNVGLVNFNWYESNTSPGSGYILHLSITTEGKLYGGSWSAISGPALIQLPAGNTTIPLNQWTHVAYVWGESGTSLYVNGVQDAFSPDNLYPALNSTFYVYVPYWGYPGIGYVDDLRITSNSQSNFGISALGLGESITCNASYVVTQTDVDNGSLTNTAQAHGFYGTTPIDSNQDSATATVGEHLQVKANFNTDEIQVWGLANGTPITLSIDNPSNGLGEDYSTTRVIEPLPWDPNQFIALFQLRDEFDILPGYVITVTGDGQSKTMTVVDIWGISIDVDADTVSGYIAAGSGAKVHVGANIDSGNLPVDESGYWIADLSLVGTDIKPGTKGYVQVDTQDGGTTWIGFEVLNPIVFVSPDEDNVYAWDWQLGTLLTLEIDNPATPQTPDYTASRVHDAIHNDWDHGFFLRDIFNIQPGYLVTVSGGGITKEHNVTHLSVTSVDVAADIVTGTAYPGSIIHVGTICDESGCANRNVLTGQDGTWLADFATPVGDPNEGTGVFDLRPGNGSCAYEHDEDGDNTRINWYAPNNRIGVRVNEDRVTGWEWPLGATVNVTIDDPSTPAVPDISRNSVVEEINPDDIRFNLELLGEFDIQPGFVVTASSGGITKTLLVTPLAFTDIDLDLDIVTGTAEPNSRVDIWACDEFHCPNRHVTADGGGVWSADFAHPGLEGDEQDTINIVLGTWIDSAQREDDGDQTMYGQNVPNPRFSVHPDEDWLEGYEWPTGVTVNVSIDDPATPDNPDKTGSAVVGESDWNPDDYYFSLNLRNIYDIKAGFVVTVTDGQIIKEHVVTNLVVTGIDEPNNLISGTADPNVHLQVNVHNEARANMQVDSDPGGNWSADFTGLYDLKLGDNGRVEEYDSDGDSTGDDWHVPNPTVGARANNDQIEGWEWPLGATVTVTVDDPSTPASPDITRTAEVYDAPWNPGEYRFDVNLFGQFDIQPGFVVTASSGGVTKSLLLTSLAFTDIDIDLDLVTGIAAAGSRVDVWSCGNNYCVNRHVTTDGGGVWSADFAHPGLENDEQSTIDIILGTWVDSSQREDDGDQTMFGQQVPNPYVEASTNSNWVHAREWPIDTLVTLTISGSGETYTATMQQAPWNPTDPNDIVADFDLLGYDIQVGDVLTASADGITKVLTLSQLSVTEFDIMADTITGIATPGVQLQVCANIENRCITRWVTADASGIWTANYHDPGTGNDDPDTFDVQAGSNGWAAEYEADADRTWYDWQVPNPNFAVHPDENVIEGSEWPLDSIVTIKIGDLAQPDYTTTTTLNPPDQDHNLPWFKLDLNGVYDLLPGELITLSDTITTKQVIAASRAITLIDPLTDIITGISDPDVVYVVLWACDENGCGARRKDVNPDGSWSVNFAVPGELNWESILIDIQHGTNGGVYQSDVDGDGTVYQWMLNEPPHADLGPDLVTDEGSTLMLDASASSDPDGDILTYEWDLNNDGEYNDAAGVTVNRTFTDDGTYFISVRVTDPFGASDTDTLEVTVNNISPLVDIQQVTVNGALVSGSGFFTDPGADVWAAAVDYGDGSGVQPLALNPDKTFALSHAYAIGGTFTIQVCVSDDESASGCDQAQVTVTLNRPPVAEAGGPYYGNEGTNITLNASRSTDPDNNIVLYEWDFDNDGQFDDATGVRPKFAAIDNGVFTIRVRVTDAGGLSSVDGSKVTVKNLPPVITSLIFNSSIRAGVRLNTFAAFTDAGVNDTFTATWKWGDGTTSTGTVSGKTVIGSHIYTRPGIYLITIIVKDKDGGVGQAYKLIIVLPKK